MKILPEGKLDHVLLSKLIANLPTQDQSIVIPPGVGLDAAGLKIGKQLVAITTDPITFATSQIGTYNVAVNINDVACLGCLPRWYSATLLLPKGTTEETINTIWQDLSDALHRYGVIAIGGHTEVTNAVNIPVIVGQMIGEAIGKKLLNARNCQPKNKILLWRPIAIEGTALLAKECYADLVKHIAPERLHTMQNLLFDPGICILPLIQKLLPIKGLVALHDITEGGIATALHEVANACGCGITVNIDAIPILPETLELAKLLNFCPLGLIASGSVLIVCKSNAVKNILQKLAGESVTLIGELTKNPAKNMLSQGKTLPLPRYDTDEIVRLLR